MRSHWYPTKDPLAIFSIPILHHTAATMSTNSIWLETFAYTPRTIQAATNDPDASTNSSDALQHNVQSSASPADAHPPANVNQAQSSQEVARVPTPRLHGAGEPAGSQRESPMVSPPNLLDFSSLLLLLHASPFTSFAFFASTCLPRPREHDYFAPCASRQLFGSPPHSGTLCMHFVCTLANILLAAPASRRTHRWRRQHSDGYWASVGWTANQCIAHRHH